MRNTGNPSFFNYIKFKFGTHTLNLFKSLIKFKRMIVKDRLRATFLRNCISHNVVPPHVRFKCDNKFFSKKTNTKFNRIKDKWTKQFLKLEIQDACCHMRYAINQTCIISYEIFKRVPVFVCNHFFYTQNISIHQFYLNETNRLNRKFGWLINKKTQQLQLKKVNYYYSVPQTNPIPQYDTKDLSITLSNNSSMEINIIPPADLKPKNALDINEKWFINLSSMFIPTHIISILQLGNNFSLPFLNKEKLTIEFIKNIENNIYKLPREKIPIIRDRSTSIINRLSSLSFPHNDFNRYVKNLVSQTREFINNNNNLILTRADKGNITVALDKDKYIQDMITILSDQSTYTVVKKDPLRKMSSSLREILNRWKNSEYISHTTHRSLICSDGILPRAYGLPKIHKPNHRYAS